MPHTSDVQPPQPVVASVFSASASMVVQPFSHSRTRSPLETPLHRQTVVPDGIVGPKTWLELDGVS